MIASNRNLFLGSKNRSLYNKRQEIVKFFDYKEPPFELYGSGWDTRFVKPGLAEAVMSRFLRKVNYLDKIERPCYKGKLADKPKLLNDTVFNFCYENITGYDGYVSEKIWDSIAAGSIPVYWPTWDIPDSYIPKWAYVDASKFSSPNDLIDYLKSLSMRKRLEWQRDLLRLAKEKQDFIKSDNYVEQIVSEIYESLT
jgi:alpha(1,3/1,4) fucosyltransferase